MANQHSPVRDEEMFPCLTQADPNKTEFEMFKDKVDHSKRTLHNCNYILSQIPMAVKKEQDFCNLLDYLVKAHCEIEKFCFKVNLCHQKFSIDEDLQIKTRIILFNSQVLSLQSKILTGVYLYLQFKNPKVHEAIAFMFKHVNIKIANYLVCINYWVLQMTPDEKAKFDL